MRLDITPRRIVAIAAAVAGAIVYSRYCQDLRASRARVTTGSRVVPTRAGPIEYAERGFGAPVLIVHGAGGGFDQGMEMFGLLARPGLRLIAVSRFGYLRTPLPDDASPAAQADAHAALLDALRIAAVSVVAASAGAPSAMEFAIRHPLRCQALVLVVPLAWRPAMEAPGDTVPSRLKQALVAAVTRSNAAFWACARVAPSLLVRTVLGTPPAVVRCASTDERHRVAAVLDHILPIDARTAGLVNEGRVARALERLPLERIAAPTLVVSARDDGYDTYASGSYISSQVPGAKFIGYDAGGHLAVGHHDAMLREIDRFLTLHTRRANEVNA